MRIVFMGTPEFAVKSLESIIKEGYEVVGVITAPDKPAGRGQQLQQSAVKQFALKHHLRVMQPEKLKDPIFVEELRALKTDLQIVVAFRMLPEVVWNMPKLGTFNLHASLLPKYRGAAPINWAVMNGDNESGITTFKLQHEIDTGHVLYRSKVSITDTMTAGELHDILMSQGAELMVKTVEALKDYLDNNTPLNFLPQNDGEATHAPKIFKETCKIEWQQNVWKIYNQIRGLSPYPGAFTEFKNEKGESVSLKIFKAEYKEQTHAFTIGRIVADKTNLCIYAKDGFIQLKDLQLQGKRRLSTEEFLRGFSFPEGTVCE
jgi:methionyl-tRNA formyltransferase